MKFRHYASIISGLLAVLGPEIGKHATWRELLAPSAIGPMLFQLGGIGAMLWGALDARPWWRRDA